MEEPKKAKLPSPEERMELILLGLARKVPIRELCRQAGVSRELFYRWLKRVRRAGLKALETEAPGPKEPVEEDPRAQIQRLQERIAALEERGRNLRKERNSLGRALGTAEGIIHRNAWKPPEKEPKKNGMRPRKTGSSAYESGTRHRPPKPEPETLPGAGESAGPPFGGGGEGGRPEEGSSA
jgi:transposase-like protein